MEHPTRQNILDFVRSHPGASARMIQRGLALAWGETAHHLGQMVVGGLLHRDRTGRRDFYFPSGMEPLDRSILAAMQSRTERAILVEIARGGHLTFGEIVERVHGGRSNVGFHLKMLTVGGLVRVEKSAGIVRYLPERPDRIMHLYGSFKDSFEEKWADRFIETWSGLVSD